ncbi:hypothetical protein GGU11DRAFT_690670 [Lentinula aff. detonsa]|nr:hypothetical protein GGU11DRAFT_690670 [Lentinula aff. detonsa]
MYTGLLGAEAARFPGQDSVDIFLTNPNGNVRIRQRVYCTQQGLSLAFYERSNDGGMTYTILPALLQRIDFNILGPTQPFVNAIAMSLPPVSPLDALLKIWIAGYPFPWYYNIHVEQFVQADNAGPLIQEPLFYHQHYSRTGHTDLDTPIFMPGGNEHQFWRLEYDTQFNSFRRASS